MAGASDKKQATSNLKILKEIHLASAIVNGLTVLSLFFLHRPSTKKYYFILSIPAFICQYVIETTGRPTYTKTLQGYQQLVKSGQDLKQSGLTEYMFDLIYITLIIDILLILFGSNKVWLLFLVVPGFAAFKLKGIVGTLLGLAGFKGFGFGKSKAEKEAAAANAAAQQQQPVKSKRQQKLEARGNKPKIRYR
ncbi:unnamed protein product [Ambrosiozyma monospora]|uniref:Unnamed protein product n=1 Tax=Ambrosiozyma monospora TaxID=43982 RepID=A0ACB5T0E5_AMBMO|nr:unnamed protein product [Ambrosiozyma monospora]